MNLFNKLKRSLSNKSYNKKSTKLLTNEHKECDFCIKSTYTTLKKCDECKVFLICNKCYKEGHTLCDGCDTELMKQYDVIEREMINKRKSKKYKSKSLSPGKLVYNIYSV